MDVIILVLNVFCLFHGEMTDQLIKCLFTLPHTQTDRQTDRWIDRQTDRWKDRQTDQMFVHFVKFIIGVGYVSCIFTTSYFITHYGDAQLFVSVLYSSEATLSIIQSVLTFQFVLRGRCLKFRVKIIILILNEFDAILVFYVLSIFFLFNFCIFIHIYCFIFFSNFNSFFIILFFLSLSLLFYL